MGKKVVYLVTVGDYDDYRVKCVFTDVESAKEAVRIGVGDAWEKSTMFVDGEQPKRYEVWYRSVTLRNGQVDQSSMWSDFIWDFEENEMPPKTTKAMVRLAGRNGLMNYVAARGLDKQAVIDEVDRKVSEILEG